MDGQVHVFHRHASLGGQHRHWCNPQFTQLNRVTKGEGFLVLGRTSGFIPSIHPRSKLLTCFNHVWGDMSDHNHLLIAETSLRGHTLCQSDDSMSVMDTATPGITGIPPLFYVISCLIDDIGGRGPLQGNRQSSKIWCPQTVSGIVSISQCSLIAYCVLSCMCSPNRRRSSSTRGWIHLSHSPCESNAKRLGCGEDVGVKPAGCDPSRTLPPLMSPHEPGLFTDYIYGGITHTKMQGP